MVFISKFFIDLRLELLESETSGPIVHTLYGLLMLLPQSEAFHTLRRRLECVAHMRPLNDNRYSLYFLVVRHLLQFFYIRSAKKWVDKRSYVCKIDFEKLTQHFVKIQEQHCIYKLETRLENMS